METIFFLTLFASVAVVGLLGFFLSASEKELKVKRREVEELLTKLESALPAGAPVEAAVAQPDHSAELTRLRAENQELQSQISSLSGQLERNQRATTELEAAQRNAEADQAEIRRLRTASEQLTAEINDLRNRLQSNESAGAASAAHNQEAAERHAHLQNEIIELKQKLQESHAKLNEADAYRQKAERLDALEAERQKSQARIAELESALASNEDQLREVASLRQRFAEAEQVQAALRAESERHEQEIARWRERIAEGENHRQRLAQLRGAYDQLLSKQALLSDRQRDFQEELAAFARLMATPARENPARDSSTAAPSGAGEDTDPSTRAPKISAAPAAEFVAAQEHGESGSTPREIGKRSFGLFLALILLATAGFFGVKFFGSSREQPSIPPLRADDAPADNLRPAAVAPAHTEALAAAAEPRTEEPRPAAETAGPKQDIAKPAQAARPQPRFAGTYEIVRPSRVYAGPTEFSQFIGEIEPGTRVNVVGGRDGWLEIHSRQGRPPGFIRREVAARLAEQN